MCTTKTLTTTREITIECTYGDLVLYWTNNPGKHHLTIEQAIANVLWLKENNHSL